MCGVCVCVWGGGGGGGGRGGGKWAISISKYQFGLSCSVFGNSPKGIFHFCPRMDFSETLYNNN